MNSKINIEALKSMIKEHVQSVLTEEKKDKKELKDSLDQQVDDFLMSYEAESKASKKNENFDFRSMTKGFLSTLLEAEEDEKPENKKKLTSEDLDIEKFASHVVRLIDNYDSLLEVRNTIARRAMNFLSENYEPSVVNEFSIVLEDQHDIVLGKTKYEMADEEFPAPPAERSGGSGGAA